MKILKKAFVLIFVVGLILGITPQEVAQASTKPGKPAITLEALENGTAVKITIQKTSGADGYKIVMKAPGATKYKKIKTLKKNGTTVRTYTVKGLKEGKYYFKVKAYNKSESKTVYSSYSKTKSISLKTSSVTIVDIGTNGTYFSVDQVNAKIKELCKKYPKYSEDEIRVLVAAANMDFVKDEDVLTIFNVSSKKGLEEKAELLDELIGERTRGYVFENYENFGFEEHIYKETRRTYKDMILFSDLSLNNKIKKNFEYLHNLSRIIVKGDVTEEDTASVKNANLAVAELLVYMLDLYDKVSYFNENNEIYKYNDQIFNDTSIGYIYKSCAVGLESSFINDIVYNSMPSNIDVDDELEKVYPRYNPLLNSK